MELVDKDSEQWYCAKDALVLYAKENRVVENVKLDLKKNTSEQVTGKLESGGAGHKGTCTIRQRDKVLSRMRREDTTRQHVLRGVWSEAHMIVLAGGWRDASS